MVSEDTQRAFNCHSCFGTFAIKLGNGSDCHVTSTLSCLKELIGSLSTEIASKILRTNQDCCTNLIKDLHQQRPKSQTTRRNQISSDDQPHLITENDFPVAIHFSCLSWAIWLITCRLDWQTQGDLSSADVTPTHDPISPYWSYRAFPVKKAAGTTTFCPAGHNVCVLKK